MWPGRNKSEKFTMTTRSLQDSTCTLHLKGVAETRRRPGNSQYLSPAGFTYGGEEVDVGGEGLQAAQQQHTPAPHCHPRESRTYVMSTW